MSGHDSLPEQRFMTRTRLRPGGPAPRGTQIYHSSDQTGIYGGTPLMSSNRRQLYGGRPETLQSFGGTIDRNNHRGVGPQRDLLDHQSPLLRSPPGDHYPNSTFSPVRGDLNDVTPMFRTRVVYNESGGLKNTLSSEAHQEASV